MPAREAMPVSRILELETRGSSMRGGLTRERQTLLWTQGLDHPTVEQLTGAFLT
jgi:hypothetical protein